MTFLDVSLPGLRVVREIADRGTFSAAAASLGYTQSAVSRQVAAVERAAGGPVFERRQDGVRLTATGRVVLRRAAAVLDEIDAADRELRGMPAETGTVRVGVFPSAGAVVLPRALTLLRRAHPGITVVSREGHTPTLLRALRAGSVDLALIGARPPFRAPDAEEPALVTETLVEQSLYVAVPTTHPLAELDSVPVAELAGQRWIAGRSSDDEPHLGAWPGLSGRPEIAHTTKDWFARLRLVAAGCGLTTAPGFFAADAPPGVRVLPVHGGSDERRRMVLARLPGRLPESARRVAEALRTATAETVVPTV
ncbi:LysR family transcriptional regulator [Streptomyces sp. 8L]|uniref:LysR family transcriptional regulator n=1 Tax=Streptomyces sp. 8L TaxID=2877242 RepID=UPI001CD5718F|nr:LysR family transcriptional regulator [Streptomyces sp. 8L]MCA1218234.1 LysR family transcriptional regulator [Streptomyces sp. 8L]